MWICPKAGKLDHGWMVHMMVGMVAYVCYRNSLGGQFVHDDVPAVLNNKDVQLDTAWLDIWSHDFWGMDITLNTSHKSYRPLTVWSFRSVYASHKLYRSLAVGLYGPYMLVTSPTEH